MLLSRESDTRNLGWLFSRSLHGNLCVRYDSRMDASHARLAFEPRSSKPGRSLDVGRRFVSRLSPTTSRENARINRTIKNINRPVCACIYIPIRADSHGPFDSDASAPTFPNGFTGKTRRVSIPLGDNTRRDKAEYHVSAVCRSARAI